MSFDTQYCHYAMMRDDATPPRMMPPRTEEKYGRHAAEAAIYRRRDWLRQARLTPRRRQAGSHGLPRHALFTRPFLGPLVG